MRPAAAVLVCGLLAVGLAFGAVAVASSDGTTDRMDMLEPADEPPSSVAYGVGGDLGLAVAATDDTLRVDHDYRTFLQELQSASADNRTELVEAYFDAREDEIGALLATERSAAAGLANGSAIADDLAITVTRIGAVAAARQDTLDHLASLDGSVSGIDLRSAALDAKHRYGLVVSPVRDRMLAGAIDPDRRTTVALEVTSSSLVMTVIDGERFHREAIGYDLLGTDEVNHVGLADAEAIAAEQYPSTTATTAARDLGAGLYTVERSMSDGSVTAFVSGATEAVVAERQYRWLDQVSVTEAGSHEAFDVTVTVERSHEGGPLRVSVVDSATGDPVEGTAYLRHDGTWTALGDVDDAGQVWSADPGGSIDIRVVTDEGTITVSSIR